MTPPTTARDAPSSPSADERRVTVRHDVVEAGVLLGRDDRLFIDHDGRRYQLRRTRNNKLILTL